MNGNIELIEVINKGTTDPEPRPQEQAKFKNPPQLDREIVVLATSPPRFTGRIDDDAETSRPADVQRLRATVGRDSMTSRNNGLIRKRSQVKVSVLSQGQKLSHDLSSERIKAAPQSQHRH
ncbi:Hypothetical protein SMAX5B_017762 [Scophthalmus maximus]|uniref:Uncharacterized protein n=1 Tax=Scophthalmus maximus TaxID=52904 RepID=A0A2U9CDH5_SCOMX|nr:Hypothetical protein SMAX5B_017762 [Scophthalmus maximus]